MLWNSGAFFYVVGLSFWNRLGYDQLWTSKYGLCPFAG